LASTCAPPIRIFRPNDFLIVQSFCGFRRISLPRHFSLFADFTNYYGVTNKGSLNSHGFTFGLEKTLFAEAKVRPGIFAETGDVRTSNAGITHQFAFNAGFNLVVPINKHFSLTATPAEWVFLYPDHDPRNDFNAKAGISFDF
jgi:hypothetical protein